MTDGTAAPNGTPAGDGGQLPTGTPAPGAPAEPAHWSVALSPELRGWAETKGLNTLTNDQIVGEALNGRMHAERSLGVPIERRIDIPADRTAEGAMDEVFSKLGRPAASTDYKFTGADAGGADKDAVDFLQGALFKAGVSGDAADAFFTEMKGWITGMEEGSANEAGIARTAQEQDLQREWGSTHEGNTNLAKAAATKLGVDGPALAAIEGAIGHAQAMKLFHTIGSGFGEDAFINGEGGGKATLTPEGAGAEIQTLKTDKGFQEKYQAGDKEARAHWDHLHSVWSARSRT